MTKEHPQAVLLRAAADDVVNAIYLCKEALKQLDKKAIKSKILDKILKKNRKGCPTCDGIDPKSCMRCFGKTKISEWEGAK